jgi:putative nucleotidyltransferase with HDIG domain
LKNTSSVGPKHSHAICEYDKRYIILGEIDLFSHTMNVVLKMIEITRELPQSTRDICILLALLHDVGKSEIAKKEHQQEAKNEDKHHKISANYAKSLIQNRIFALDDDINHDLQELVYNCLNKHHDKDENEHNIFLELLKKADFSARDDEYAEIIFKRKKILELKERKKQ